MKSDPIKSLALWGIVAALLIVAYNIPSKVDVKPNITCPSNHDDSDPVSGYSGMCVLTDHKTGCQYLSRHGGLVPRWGADDKQVCNTPTVTTCSQLCTAAGLDELPDADKKEFRKCIRAKLCP